MTSRTNEKPYGLEEYLREQKRLENCQDLRDDTCSIVLNAGNMHGTLDNTLEYIHGHSGPHPSTIRRWLNKEVNAPHMGKIRSTLEILGYRLSIEPKG